MSATNKNDVKILYLLHEAQECLEQQRNAEGPLWYYQYGAICDLVDRAVDLAQELVDHP